MNMNSQESRNLILAIVLSAIVLIGWNYFLAPKLPQRPAGNAPIATQTTPPAQRRRARRRRDGVWRLERAHRACRRSPAATRAEALAESPRVAIDTAALGGSINLDRRPPRRSRPQGLSRDDRPRKAR